MLFSTAQQRLALRIDLLQKFVACVNSDVRQIEGVFMLNNWINVTRVGIHGADRLYPKGLDWYVAPGVNAVVGGTSLGKTTLVYALQFAVSASS